MRNVGFIFLGFTSKSSEKIVEKTKELVKVEFNAKVYTNKSNQDDGYIEEMVKSALEECGIALFFIDAKSEANFRRSFEIGIRTMYAEAETPIFVLTNFEGMSLEEVAECKNLVGNILYNNGWVAYDDRIDCKTMFFSPENGLLLKMLFCMHRR